MSFLVAGSFTSALTRLTAQEQMTVKTTAFDLHMNRSAPGLPFSKLDRAKDTNSWPVRVKRASLVASEPEIAARITVKAITAVGCDL